MMTRKLIYYVFDLPWAEGRDLSSLRLIERKQILKALLIAKIKKLKKRNSELLRRRARPVARITIFFSTCATTITSSVLAPMYWAVLAICNWKALFPNAVAASINIAAQRLGKEQVQHEQEFVIAGYTKTSRPAYRFGALLLGYYQEEELMYCGRVGTGFTETSLRELTRRLKQLETDECPYAVRPKGPQLRGVTWLEPRLVAEISYATRTSDGILRHSVFHGLREDKPAEQISWEQAVSPKRSGSQASTKSSKPSKSVTNKRAIAEKAKRGKVRDVGGVITHPDRVVYPEAEITKQELVNYFQEVGQWMLPGIVGRPLALLRCPQGVEQHCFYQKEFDEQSNAGIDRATIREKEAETTYAVVRTSMVSSR